MNNIKRLIDINMEITKNAGNNEKLTEERMELVTKIEPNEVVDYMLLNGNKDNHGKVKYELYKIRNLCGCIPHNILLKAEDIALANKKFSHVERLTGGHTATYRVSDTNNTEKRLQMIRKINELTENVKRKAELNL